MGSRPLRPTEFLNGNFTLFGYLAPKICLFVKGEYSGSIFSYDSNYQCFPTTQMVKRPTVPIQHKNLKYVYINRIFLKKRNLKAPGVKYPEP